VAKSNRYLDKVKELTSFSPVFDTLINGVNVDIQFESK
jgi:hypothetical protein